MARGKPFQPGDPRPAASGRRRGTPNRRTVALEACTRAGVDPFEVLANFAARKGNPKPSQSQQLYAARELASYIAPKLKSMELTGRDGEPLESQIDWTRLSVDQLSQVATAFRIVVGIGTHRSGAGAPEPARLPEDGVAPDRT